ncbi:hypothetical protein EN794_042900 [Mesorhizobium sp. M00.F.Ca.ET.151.01.1.1]|nr:hypothetical protein EN794_042900 [Mesorhizobium sp. M00.F.Ca.ET.151.01.1.1]
MLAGAKPPETDKVACRAESEFICITGVKRYGGGTDDDHARQRRTAAGAAAMSAVLAMMMHVDLLNAGSGVCRGDLLRRRFIPAWGKSGCSQSRDQPVLFGIVGSV